MTARTETASTAEATKSAGATLAEICNRRLDTLAQQARKEHPDSRIRALDRLHELIGADVDLLWHLLRPHWALIGGERLRRVAPLAPPAGQEQPAQRATRHAPASARGPASERMAAGDASARAFLMERTTELGKPLGDLTALEAQALAERSAGRERQERAGRLFYGWIAQRLTTQGGGDKDRVRDLMSEDELFALDRQARGASHAS